MRERRRRFDTESWAETRSKNPLTPPEIERVRTARREFDPLKPIDNLQAVSWNVRFTSPVDNIVETIDKLEANHGLIHILCAQEIPYDPATLNGGDTDSKAQEIAKKLGFGYVTFLPRTRLRHNRLERDKYKRKNYDFGSGLAIFSRFPFVEGSDTFDVLSQGKGGPDFYKYRYGFQLLQKIDIQIPHRDPLKIGNYHLSTSTQYPWIRSAEFRELERLLPECDLAFGDANIRPGSRKAGKLFHALPRSTVNSDQPTYQERFFGVEIRRRIDYAHAKQPKFIVSTTIASAFKGPSDHSPLLHQVKYVIA